jgi:hypothetical protein
LWPLFAPTAAKPLEDVYARSSYLMPGHTRFSQGYNQYKYNTRKRILTSINSSIACRKKSPAPLFRKPCFKVDTRLLRSLDGQCHTTHVDCNCLSFTIARCIIVRKCQRCVSQDVLKDIACCAWNNAFWLKCNTLLFKMRDCCYAGKQYKDRLKEKSRMHRVDHRVRFRDTGSLYFLATYILFLIV